MGGRRLERESSCFFCLTSVTNDDEKTEQNFQSDISTLFGYLGLDADKFRMVTQVSLASVCSTCSELLEQFSTMFRLWVEVDMALNLFCLEPLRKRLDLEHTVPNMHYGSKLEEAAAASRLRETVKRKCMLSSLTKVKII